MTARQAFWHKWTRPKRAERPAAAEPAAQTMPAPAATTIDLDMAPNDPLVAYLENVGAVVETDRLPLDSPALRALRAAGVRLIVPLVSQGELIGLINLGPRLSEQEYSSDDRKLLNDLATQAAPAVRVAQLARQQQAEARARERLEQELHVARLIQQTLLPQDVPHLPGYEISAYYQPAREVGGDFYDFIYFDDGRVGLVIGDVTDKGVPAALVMATTRTLIRAAAERLVSPGHVLERVNDLLHPDIPARMFVTCLFALLDPASGHLRYANAGHDLPYRRRPDGADELRATGMPLGLFPGMHYEEKEVTLAPGETLLFHSDGLVEAHNERGEMFGFPRLKSLVAEHPDGTTLVPFLLGQLADFTGPRWEQEDDVTLVMLQVQAAKETTMSNNHDTSQGGTAAGWQTLAEFDLPSEPGNEREAMVQVAEAIEGVSLPAAQVEKLKTAVAEATMNAMEHGNQYRADRPVAIQVLASETAVAVRITDYGGDKAIAPAETPDLEAKLAGLQTPRGWGLFLIQNMVDELNIISDSDHHTVELIMYFNKGGQDGAATA